MKSKSYFFRLSSNPKEHRHQLSRLQNTAFDYYWVFIFPTNRGDIKPKDWKYFIIDPKPRYFECGFADFNTGKAKEISFNKALSMLQDD